MIAVGNALQLDESLPKLPETVLNIPVQLQFTDAESGISAQLVRVERGFLKLFSPVAFRADSSILLLIDECTIRAEVVSCEALSAGRFALAVRRVYGPQGAIRFEPRIPVDLSATLTYPGCDRIFARVVDMSPSGLGFELSAPLAVGSRVSVHFACGIAFGEIRHCTKTAAVYRAGMQIDEFIVRQDGTIRDRGTANKGYESRLPLRVRQRLLGFRKRAFCFVAGHEYGWSTDAWERAVLRCSYCERLLNA